ncbi:short-chain dehydrogenase/reductase SDR [Gluconacetobacter diazotrophicus PA1 5]|uniref:Putative short-chain dehydrogenase n=1 Tax=Gluconacetobacter diazotrophicus (strain ATCC 49037 / DSM 5601 / CCUG 37298 / CIP 103539 / LMG 7603 / PAl5) TaxID=272568 RepID=A9HDA5_GLUDA|nr:SDR family NAD(P)-dependent oxidoreductase [Gluconacetobacter diazotrophicus]ACI51604.1 short-chain dehydrogenase/reductase SDR [Gluconacetobacter diazotrophicus PA1 5]TWB02854.1 short-subunit dehydrogenase [Gluconacetobacter diazotrophicus]CAP55074.1 putative short-chain dehydrogenase [Gluconacetobacter diazotrophicus PA1 5]
MKQDTILITGASSGIGRAIALALAAPGVVLHLGGRDAGRLDAVARACADRGARAQTRRQDVRDQDGMARWIGDAGPLDLVFACAGITASTARPAGGGAPREPDGQVRRIMDVNVGGVVNTVLPALATMGRQARDPLGVRGRICAIASVAGYVSFPGTPSYCASKAAVDRFMVATGGNTARDGILLSSVCCGFVRTPMVAANRFPMPGLVEAGDAAAAILRGVAAGRRRIAFPWWLAAGSRLMDRLPLRWAEAYYARQPAGQAGSMPETGGMASFTGDLP